VSVANVQHRDGLDVANATATVGMVVGDDVIL